MRVNCSRLFKTQVKPDKQMSVLLSNDGQCSLHRTLIPPKRRDSQTMLTLALSLVAILVGYGLYLWRRHPSNFPPHPTLSVPFIGDLLLLGSDRVAAFSEMRKKYGDIFGYLLGSERFIVISDYELMQEIGNKDELIGSRINPVVANIARSSIDPFDQEKSPGLITSTGRVWQEQRRFSLQILRTIGVGKQTGEEVVLEEAKILCDSLESFREKAFDAKQEFDISSLNAIWKICTGERFPRESPKLREIAYLLDEIMKNVSGPILTFLLRQKTLNKLVGTFYPNFSLGVFGKIMEVVDESVKEAQETYQEDCPRHLIDHYLKMMKDQECLQQQLSFVGKEGEVNLTNALVDLFIAGSDSTSVTLRWAMLYMILCPSIQAKIHDELDDNIGKGLQPRFSDRVKTPYVEAALVEIQRLANISDGAALHCARSDCYISTGHFIPKDTMIYFWMGPVMWNPVDFPEPFKCDPMRHLSKEGSLKPHPKVIPFGIGKRRCLGETMAKMELYIFFTSIMARFKVEKGHPRDELTAASIGQAHLTPHPFQMKLQLRDS